MKQVIRIRSSQGQQRLEIDPATETYIQLLNKIASNMGVNAKDIALHPEDQRGPALRVLDKTVIGRIPQLQENGVMVFVKENLNAQKQIKETQAKTSEPPKPITTPSNYKMEIEEESKQEKKPEPKKEETKPEEEYKPKCAHGPNGRCVNCITIDKDKDKIKQGMMKAHCNHGPNGKCVHCLGSEYIASAKHISFDQFWHDRTLKCATLHPRTEKCPHCTPLENPSYKVNRDCKEHPPFPKSMCAKCLPPSISVRRQHFRHVDYCSIMNVKDIAALVSHWKKQDFHEQRFAFMYGYYAEDPNYPLGIRACVEALYEPPQIGDISGYQLLDDNLRENADRIAAALGMELIGQVFTSINHDVPLSQQEVRQAARYQHQFRVNHQTGYTVSKFITCVLRTGKQNPSDVAPEVYMVSDQAVNMERDNIFADNEDSRKYLKIRKPVDVNDIIPNVLAEAKPVKEFEPDWFIVNVAVGNMPDTKYNILKHFEFPSTNRQASEQNNQMVKKYLTRFQKEPSYIRFSDFHLLLYISTKIDIETACTLANFIAEEKEIPQQTVEFIQQILGH